MPAYFAIDFAYRKSDIIDTTFKSFVQNLIRFGLLFKSGFWHAENDSFDDIINWNQQKLKSNFILGYKEHYSKDYKQILFNYEGFSEVRLFISLDASLDSFSFELIVPEEDLYRYENNKVCKSKKKMNLLEELALNMWNAENISCIQTYWECSDVPPSPEEINHGAIPSSEPFSIVSENVYKECWNLVVKKTQRSGLLLKNDDNWNPL